MCENELDEPLWGCLFIINAAFPCAEEGELPELPNRYPGRYGLDVELEAGMFWKFLIGDLYMLYC